MYFIVLIFWRQVEHGVLSNVEKANGIVTLLKELTRFDEFAVAVAAAHCLRRIFSQLLDPAKNPQVRRGPFSDSLRISTGLSIG